MRSCFTGNVLLFEHRKGSSAAHLSGDGLQQLRGKAFNLALVW